MQTRDADAGATRRRQALVGATAGAVTTFTLYPLSTLKVRCHLEKRPTASKTPFRGAGVDSIGAACSTALYFPLYQAIGDRGIPPALAGALAGLGASIISAPVEVLRQQMQAGRAETARQALTQVLGGRGGRLRACRSLYRGYSAFLMRELPFDAIQMGTFEGLSTAYRRARRRRPCSSLRGGEAAGIGALAGAVTGLVTAPCDTARTLMSVRPEDGLRVALSRDGLRALSRGAVPRALEISLGGAVFFASLNVVDALLRSVQQRRTARKDEE
mmetsp:Transcript_3993/g.13994  ORF Transcript_3993/g.13994 Transcript_3993/m.13994 type:complete len:273 (+) Transcript_3993:75-893(+)